MNDVNESPIMNTLQLAIENKAIKKLELALGVAWKDRTEGDTLFMSLTIAEVLELLTATAHKNDTLSDALQWSSVKGAIVSKHKKKYIEKETSEHLKQVVDMQSKINEMQQQLEYLEANHA